MTSLPCCHGSITPKERKHTLKFALPSTALARVIPHARNPLVAKEWAWFLDQTACSNECVGSLAWVKCT